MFSANCFVLFDEKSKMKSVKVYASKSKSISINKYMY